MPSAPERYVAWINAHVGFNPRVQSHSDELTRGIADLRERCPALAEHLAAQQLELRLNVGIEGKRNAARGSGLEAEDDDDSAVDPTSTACCSVPGFGRRAG